MPWGAIAGAVIGAVAAQNQHGKVKQDGKAWDFPEDEVKAEPKHKCESCGSRQFMVLNGNRICAYCRSEQ